MNSVTVYTQAQCVHFVCTTEHRVHSFRNLEGSGVLAREYVARSPKPYPLASMLSSVAMTTTVVLAQSAEVQCAVEQGAGLKSCFVFHLFLRQLKRCCALRSVPKHPLLEHCQWQACGKSDGTPQLRLQSRPVEAGPRWPGMLHLSLRTRWHDCH